MPQNRIQFQPGLSMDKFPERYGTKAQCEEALVTARRPQGFVCPQLDAGEQLDGSWQMASRAWLQPAGVSTAWLIDDPLPTRASSATPPPARARRPGWSCFRRPAARPPAPPRRTCVAARASRFRDQAMQGTAPWIVPRWHRGLQAMQAAQVRVPAGAADPREGMMLSAWAENGAPAA